MASIGKPAARRPSSDEDGGGGGQDGHHAVEERAPGISRSPLGTPRVERLPDERGVVAEDEIRLRMLGGDGGERGVDDLHRHENGGEQQQGDCRAPGRREPVNPVEQGGHAC
jgi:hypothetical protein